MAVPGPGTISHQSPTSCWVLVNLNPWSLCSLLRPAALPCMSGVVRSKHSNFSYKKVSCWSYPRAMSDKTLHWLLGGLRRLRQIFPIDYAKHGKWQIWWILPSNLLTALLRNVYSMTACLSVAAGWRLRICSDMVPLIEQEGNAVLNRRCPVLSGLSPFRILSRDGRLRKADDASSWTTVLENCCGDDTLWMTRISHLTSPVPVPSF